MCARAALLPTANDEHFCFSYILGLRPRCSLDGVQIQSMSQASVLHGVREEGGESAVSDFDFRPIHRLYTYTDGGVPARTIVVLEVNLPSGVNTKIFDSKVDDDGSSLQIEYERLRYMTEPRVFNAIWLSPTRDGSLRLTDSKMTQSQISVQDIKRRNNLTTMKSTCRFMLPCTVERSVGSVKVSKLAFMDNEDTIVKTN